MGIQLDWQIESERQQRRATEDPEARRLRRQRRRQLLVVVLGIAMAICVVVGGVLWRLQWVEDRLRQDLLDTVDAEVRALKIGDQDNFMAIRRSDSTYWQDAQLMLYADYQQRKNSGELEITGDVLDVEMDIEQSRARVVLEEQLNGVPYEVAWFYWRYTDEEQGGWRRVPPDIDFWGDESKLSQGNVRVVYHTLDETTATALAADVGTWWQPGCEWLDCGVTMPTLEIRVEPRDPALPTWDLNDEWTIIVTSPLHSDRARRDGHLSEDLEQPLARMVAERTVDYLINADLIVSPLAYTTSVLAYADTVWFLDEFERWLQGRFIGADGSPFLDSMIAQYGDGIPGQLVNLLGPNAQVGPVLQSTTGTAVPAMPLTAIDWRSYFEWRLTLEARILRGDEQIPQEQIEQYHNALYDDNALLVASNNRAAFVDDLPPVHRVDFDGFGQPDLLAKVYDENGGRIAVFRWVETTWKRYG